MAHRCGMLEGADILVNLDADGFTGPDFATYLADHFSSKHIFMQAMWNRWVERDGVKEWLTEDCRGNFVEPVPKGCNGRVAISTNAFLKSGGYDEKYNTWGPDDKDLNIRLRRLGYQQRLIDRKHLETILHNDKVRFREYPQVAGQKGNEFQITIHDSKDTIANWGCFGCGVVYRNFSPDPIKLGPLPTRIFGIGMHKTATTSLHMALKFLGLDSAHWTSAHWAKAIWREMNNDGVSPTLEQHYALCDLPISMLYRKLDAAYPGSKFIFTMTSEEAWVKAAERHWDPMYNHHRQAWDTDPFTHRVHEVLYGRTDFDRETFLKRYRHHNRDVLTYFTRRPEDLLVMKMSEGAGWKELCGFLGMPIPNHPYPHGNRDGGEHEPAMSEAEV
jgi:hypothetical protein